MKVSFDSASIVGIDGCKKGWCCSFDHEDKIKTIVIEEISHVKDLFPSAQHILIDIPIGLESKTRRRDLDRYARKHLARGSTSSVFTPPSREAVKAKNYTEACQTNLDISGKKISIQSWNISKKILEVDTLILQNKSLMLIFRESHPEICFKYLNKNLALTHRKRAKAKLGIDERLQILSKYEKDIYTTFQYAQAEYGKNELSADDMVDSLCLYITGKLGALHGFSLITGSTLVDEHGIDLKLYYFDPGNLPRVETMTSHASVKHDPKA